MPEEQPALRSGATAPDPYAIASASDDLAGAVRLLDLACRTSAAELQRVRLLAGTDRQAAVDAWHAANHLLHEAVMQTDRASKALIALAVTAARTMPDAVTG